MAPIFVARIPIYDSLEGVRNLNSSKTNDEHGCTQRRLNSIQTKMRFKPTTPADLSKTTGWVPDGYRIGKSRLMISPVVLRRILSTSSIRSRSEI